MSEEVQEQVSPAPEIIEPEAVINPIPPMTPTAPEPASTSESDSLEFMLDLPLEVTVELGRTTMQLGEALTLQPGSIIELNRLPGEALDMHLNDRLVARGEVVVVNDALALRITQVVGRGRG